MDDTLLNFSFPKESPSIIKVIGVGGGGGNAVSHMYKEGIHDVTFVLCNTDNQALSRSDIPFKLTLGRSITQGLGAGNRPERARSAAEESKDDIHALLNDGTKMVFITAGMGGGTGTGAAPVIAGIAKEMGILTIGIVTIPFLFEGERKIIQALYGVEEISKNVDALLVINNERLRELYAEFSVKNAFARADDILTVAAKSIAEIITLPGIINLDFADVSTILRNGGVAVMSSGYGEGERRVSKSIVNALNSPLLNNNDVFRAKKILLNISYSETDTSELKMEEINEVHEFMSRFNREIEVIWGTAIDNSLGNKVKITILATGFGMRDIPEIDELWRNEAKRLTAEELARQEEQDRKEQEESQMIQQYYGEMATSVGRPSGRARAVVLTSEEMDEDTLIAVLEEHPTYNRDPKLITRVRAELIKPVSQSGNGAVQLDDESDDRSVIHF